MKRYKVVGWYSRDPNNEHIAPFARVVFVETDSVSKASQLGSDALDKLYEEKGESVDFLNWFTSEV